MPSMNSDIGYNRKNTLKPLSIGLGVFFSLLSKLPPEEVRVVRFHGYLPDRQSFPRMILQPS